MTAIGLTDEDRRALKEIDFSRDVVLDFWMYLDRYPEDFQHIFTVRKDDFKNSLAVGLRGRRLKVYHGNGEHRVIMFNRELRESTLPVRTWVQVSIKRTVDLPTVLLDLTVGKFRKSVRRRQSGADLMPYNFPDRGRPDVLLLSDQQHIGLISGFRFEGAGGQFIAYEQGRVVSNVRDTTKSNSEIPAPLKSETKRFDIGNQNLGVYLHTLRGGGDGEFRLVEKKTKKPLEIAMAKFLFENQLQDSSLREIFPAIYWMEEQHQQLTYLMEYVPGVNVRQKTDILDVMDSITENLKELSDAGERYSLASVLPNTIRGFEKQIAKHLDDPELKPVRDKIVAYTDFRKDLADGRILLCHNDVWTTNVGAPIGSHGSRFIDIGRVSMNFLGADLFHFRRYFVKDLQLWERIVQQYSEAFGEDPETVKTGTLAYAVERSLESYMRRRRRGVSQNLENLGNLLDQLLANRD